MCFHGATHVASREKQVPLTKGSLPQSQGRRPPPSCLQMVLGNCSSRAISVGRVAQPILMQSEGIDPCPTLADTYNNSITIDDFSSSATLPQTPIPCQQSIVYSTITKGRGPPVQRAAIGQRTRRTHRPPPVLPGSWEPRQASEQCLAPPGSAGCTPSLHTTTPVRTRVGRAGPAPRHGPGPALPARPLPAGR